jgi:CheY-like chemotaxis protein
MSKIILCADDSATIQLAAEITFRGTDYSYVGARSVEEALDKAKGQKPALVLADAIMGDRSGYDLCLALKTEGGLADVPVIILCGNSQAYDSARGSQVGADGTLPKPWDSQTMTDKCAEFIAKASAGVARPGAAASAPAVKPAAAIPAPKPAAVPAPAPMAAKDARSATIMGMPTVKLPGGMPAPAPAPAPAPVAAAPAPAPAAPRAPRPSAPPVSVPAPASASMAAATASLARNPMIAGMPTKRSALVERTLAKMAARLAEAAGIEPGSPELLALLKLSTEVVERIVWEVVPELAEAIIRENLQELTARRGN